MQRRSATDLKVTWSGAIQQGPWFRVWLPCRHDGCSAPTRLPNTAEGLQVSMEPCLSLWTRAQQRHLQPAPRTVPKHHCACSVFAERLRSPTLTADTTILMKIRSPKSYFELQLQQVQPTSIGWTQLFSDVICIMLLFCFCLFFLNACSLHLERLVVSSPLCWSDSLFTKKNPIISRLSIIVTYISMQNCWKHIIKLK